MTDSEGSGIYFDKDGSPLDVLEWAGRFEDWDYRLIAKNEHGRAVVLTVWQGTDVTAGLFGNRIPCPIDTVVFTPSGSLRVLARLPNEWEAIVGHMIVSAEMVEKYGPKRLEEGES